MPNWTYRIGRWKEGGLFSNHWERRKILTEINTHSLKLQNYEFLICCVSEYKSVHNFPPRSFVFPSPSSSWPRQMPECRSFEFPYVTLFIWERILVPPNFHSAGNLLGLSAHHWIGLREIWRRIHSSSMRHSGRGTANIL